MNNTNETTSYPISDFYLSYLDKLYENSIFRKQIFSLRTPEKDVFGKHDNELSKKELFNKIIIQLLEEAKLTLSLINDQDFTKKDSLLEIGGGLGLVYGFLKKQGYDIWGIEPSDPGFEGSFSAAIQLFKIIGVDESHFQPFLAKEAAKLHRQFDIIFSNNVLEHIPELEESISSLGNVLKPNGIMIHNNANYFIPYDPHFRTVLFPFFPRLIEFFKPSLKKSSLWNGLNFITTHKLRRACNASNLKIEFRRDRLLKTFIRLECDPEFAEKHKAFVPIYKILKLLKLTKFLDKIPSALTSPITFTIYKRKAA